MLNPPIESLVKKVNSKYALVIATAKRARQIVATRRQNLLDTRKAVTVALTEILEDKVKVVRPDETNKADKRGRMGNGDMADRTQGAQDGL
ncbi:MAG TPA: DNA-directed RNA polymerase subunit omega [Firmicutes bacterium]|nr:DNA-directed RNA polymerase subunit omega [Candidatus Fermentithermobacillaceae bacterium]